MLSARAQALGFVLAAALMASGLALPAWLAVVLLTVTLAIAPGMLAARVVAPASRGAERTLLALVLSPLLAGAPAAALLALGMTPVAAARIVAGAIAALALLAVAWPAPGGEDSDGPAPWLAAVAWTGFVAALVLGNPHLLPRSDGWFHAAVTLQVARHGLPLEDPFFAGLRLLYFWGLHVWAALWRTLAPSVSVWTPFVVLDLAAAVAVMLGVTRLARRLGADVRGQIGAAALAALGYQPLGWLVLLARVCTGQVRGWDEARQLLGHGVEPVLAGMNPNLLHASMGFFGDKYLIATPLGLGLALALAATLALLDAIEHPSARRWLTVGLLQCAALFLHSVVGWADAIVAAGWWLTAVMRARRPEDAPVRRALLPLPLVFALATLVLLPYLRATTFGKHQSFHFGLDGPTLRTWLFAGLAYVPLGMGWLVSASRRPGSARELLVMTAALTLAALFLGLPLGNQSKLFNLLFVLLAAPAAMGLFALLERGGWTRVAMMALVVGGMLPTTLLYTWGFATERGQHQTSWDRPDTPDERAAWEWVRLHATRDAVIVDADARLDMTVLADRSTLWGGDGWAKNWGYEPQALEQRRAAAATVGVGLPPASEVRAMLGALGRDVLVVARRDTGAPEGGLWTRRVAGAAGTPIAGGYVLVYRNASVAILLWDAGR